MHKTAYQADVIIVGAGLAGLVAAHELLGRSKKIVIFEKGKRRDLGGLARESFGGVHLIGTPQQKRMRIKDDPNLAYRDWESVACFPKGENQDFWPKKWAKFYCENSIEYIYDFLDEKGVRFLPVVNWAERGLHQPGNSVPRWHVAWGIGHEIVRRVWNALETHKNWTNLEILFEHEVSALDLEGGRVVGVSGTAIAEGTPFHARSESVVIAAGGICGGDLSKVKANWNPQWGKAPRHLLNGAHVFGDGLLHDQVAKLGGNVTHLDQQWHYAAGIHHPLKRKPNDGLSLVPPRSALWLNARGERIGPIPLVSYANTRFLVESILKEPGQYSWQLMNWKIAIKELAVSGCDYMTAFRYKKKWKLLWHLLFGNKELVRRLIQECAEDLVVADSLPELAAKMDGKSLEGQTIDLQAMTRAVQEYDQQIERGPAFYNDEQLRWIGNFRRYRGDRIRTCDFQKILDPRAKPLIAIREFILTRKSLGGIQTDLQCRVLRAGNGEFIPGLYAVGEAAGFGGGGIHGQGSLEGTFLGSCVLTGRIVGRSIP